MVTVVAWQPDGKLKQWVGLLQVGVRLWAYLYPCGERKGVGMMAHRLVLTLGLVVASALPILADDDDCTEPMATWQPRSEVSRMAAEQGWTVRRIKIDEGCYRLDARDATGKPVHIWLNPATLQILEIDDAHEAQETHEGPEHREEDDPKD